MMNDEVMFHVVLTRLYFSSPLLLSQLGVIPVTIPDFVYNTAPSSFTLASFHSRQYREHLADQQNLSDAFAVRS